MEQFRELDQRRAGRRGDTVVFNQGTTSNPDGYDNIPNLFLDDLTLTQGFVSVTGTLQIGTLRFSASFGEITSTTLPGNASSLLTVDGFAGVTGGQVAAAGAGAVVDVLATSDPGEVYFADDGGEVELTALPIANSTLEFNQSTTAATFALRNAGGTIAAALFDAAVGKSIALPGSSVSSVTFGSHSIAIVTNLGTTTFSNVTYVSGEMPTGYTVSADPTGLERITFAGPKTTTFQQGQTGSVGNFLGYAWSNSANWTNGVPVDGDTVVFNQGTTSNPDGYDNIPNLFLDDLTLTQGFVSVTGTLQIGTLRFSASFGEITSTTLPGNASSLLTVDGFAGVTGGQVAAAGAGAVVDVLATSDPGEVYFADDGGEVELTALPIANSTLEFNQSTTAATFALRNAGGTIAAALFDAAVGKSIALPGSSVSSVTFGSHSIAIVTNLGTTTFSNVTYVSGEMPTGYTVSADPTGLERITFACYVAGTYIATPAGDVAVERLAIGDEVVTASGGTRPIKWIGWRALDLRQYGTNPAIRPVRIRTGAFGEGLPRRDLLVSPEHAVFVDGVLVPARCLVGCEGVSVELEIEQLIYFHVELPRHDVILAEGLPCESWLDTGNRGMFQNAPVVSPVASETASGPTAESAWATGACAALLTDGPALQAIRSRLGAGRLQDAIIDRVGAHSITIKPGTTGVRLVSSAGYAEGDRRLLGVAVAWIEYDGQPIALTDGRLARGFHEAEAGWRWTSGAGVIECAMSDISHVLRVDVARAAAPLAVAA